MHRNTHVNIDTYVYDKICTGIPMSILTRDTLPPSLPHSPKRRELVKDARRQHADRIAAQFEVPGHETRRQSALTHSTSTCPLCPSACTFMHVPHAHAPCTCTCAPWFILSLHMRALCMRERMCMRVRKCMHLYS